jgi:hypothetical protein
VGSRLKENDGEGTTAEGDAKLIVQESSSLNSHIDLKYPAFIPQFLGGTNWVVRYHTSASAHAMRMRRRSSFQELGNPFPLTFQHCSYTQFLENQSRRTNTLNCAVFTVEESSSGSRFQAPWRAGGHKSSLRLLALITYPLYLVAFIAMAAASFNDAITSLTLRDCQEYHQVVVDRPTTRNLDVVRCFLCFLLLALCSIEF